MYQVAPMRTPTGKFILVGSLPLVLTRTLTDAYGKEFQASFVYETEAEALAALEAAQLPC